MAPPPLVILAFAAAAAHHDKTALSQRYNLYLVAGGARLWAYEPLYSSQHLTNHPQLSIETDPHPDARLGDIDPLKPDAINNIIVANLGEDEIVVCACDDGDVYAYYTRAIFDSIQRAKSEDQPESTSAAAQIRPFFHKNIRRSAWGLAVHQEARLIAASCNAHDIYVFAFALHDERRTRHHPSGDIDVDIDIDTSSPLCLNEKSCDGWKFQPHPDAFVMRDEDSVIRLEGHGHNIPALAFCNTSDDMEGRYLVSTDIEGVTIVWDIIEQVIERRSRANDGFQNPAGWALHFLDRRSFRRSDARTALTEKAKFAVNAEPDGEYGMLDISPSRGVFARSRPWFPMSDDAQTQDEDVADSDTDLDRGEDRSLPEWDTADGLTDEASTLGDEVGDEDEMPLATPFSRRPRFDQVYRIPHSGLEQHATANASAFDACPSPDHVGTLRSEYAGRDGPQPVPFSPLMRFTADSVVLYQTAMLEFAPRHQPYTVFHGPLSQEVPTDWVLLMRHIDRMNLTVQLDDLGVVLAGSPKGRVAVFSLHQIWPNPIVERSPDPVYTFRLDAILPLPAEEAMLRRPSQALAGVAAGPVQGHFGRSGHGRSAGAPGIDLARRYRVMLLYRDHSILCYEIWRDREVVKDGVGTGVGMARSDVPFV